MILPFVSIQNFSCISGFAEGMLKDAKRQMVMRIEVEELAGGIDNSKVHPTDTPTAGQ